jgi:hypothetical protein
MYIKILVDEESYARLLEIIRLHNADPHRVPYRSPDQAASTLASVGLTETLKGQLEHYRELAG